MLPTKKMLMPMIMGCAIGPVLKASWATHMANIPATKLPTALLKPRLKVAPNFIFTKRKKHKKI